MDALTATKPIVLVLDIKTIPAHFHLTNQPQHKFLNLLLEITRLFTLKGVPLIGKKNVKSRKNHFIHRPESRHRAIKRNRATDEPTGQSSQNRRAIKTIPALSYLTNQPQQKFKLALMVRHSVPKAINRHVSDEHHHRTDQPHPPEPSNRCQSLYCHDQF